MDVEPYTREEIARVLKVCNYSREAETFIRRKFAMRRPKANRDQSIRPAAKLVLQAIL